MNINQPNQFLYPSAGPDAVRDKGNIEETFWTTAEKVTMSNATSYHILQEGRRMFPAVPIFPFFNETGVYRTMHQEHQILLCFVW